MQLAMAVVDLVVDPRVRYNEKEPTTMTRERLIEIYEVELRQAFDGLGDDFDLCRDDIDFTDGGAVICGETEMLPAGSVEPEQLAGYL